MLTSQAASVSKAGASDLDRAIELAVGHLCQTQADNGAWKGDYGGPMFLLPMYVGTAYIIGLPIESHVKSEMVRYLRAQQNPDGGFGLHVEGHSQVFTSVLVYVALRLLGVGTNDSATSKAGEFITENGGPTAAASWGKFFLCVLGLHDYRGITPLMPELWLLPTKLPVHPSRLWCHCRMVYLPMAWLYGARAVQKGDALLDEIRAELYPDGYQNVDWSAARTSVSDTDSYVEQGRALRGVRRMLTTAEKRIPKRLRARAQRLVLSHIDAEDKNTSYVCIGPVSKLLNTLVWHFHAPDGEESAAHVERLSDYLWQGADGVKMQGYNSSELWDTAFSVQALVAAGVKDKSKLNVREAMEFVDRTQVREDVADHERFFRHPSKGGWPFSTREHGWPISDCTAEGMKACLRTEGIVDDPVSGGRLADAADLLLGMQNQDGGFATYELTRGPKWLEQLNLSDCFADIMIDYSYVECTAAVIEALTAFQDRYPDHRPREIREATERAANFILEAQREDGSWEGSWGICFTYGTMFGVKGLLSAGYPPQHPALRKAAAFLEKHQASDGGWGEDAESCRARRYVPTEESQAVMTAWALSSLVALGKANTRSVDRAVRFLLLRQKPDGSFPSEHIAGMFNKTSAIHYDNYLKIFPLWALADARTALGIEQQ